MENMSQEPAGRREPPHNLEAERALLGSLLLDPERVVEAAEIVRADDFFDKRLGTVYGALVRLAEKGMPVELVTLGEALRAEGRFEELGGRAFLVDLAQSVTSSAHFTHHARIVSETSILRSLIREASEILGRAFDTRPDGEAVHELLDECEQKMFHLARAQRGDGVQELSGILTEAFQRIDARSHRQGLTGLTTGFHDLDEKLSGLNAGDFVVVAARPSMGKTAFALNVMERAASSIPEWLDRKPSVLLFSLEMGRLSVVERMLCTRARVEGHRLRTGRLTGEEHSDLAAAADELRDMTFFIDDSPHVTAMSLRSRARRIMARHGLDLIVVDYLQLLSYPGAESRQQEISSISRMLKGIARELNIPVVALAQLSRQVESRDPPRPQLADLRESGSIEQDADVVMLLYRPEYYEKYRTDENRGLAEVFVAKHRNGPTGIVRLQFFPDTMRFENRELGVAESIAPLD